MNLIYHHQKKYWWSTSPTEPWTGCTSCRVTQKMSPEPVGAVPWPQRAEGQQENRGAEWGKVALRTRGSPRPRKPTPISNHCRPWLFFLLFLVWTLPALSYLLSRLKCLFDLYNNDFFLLMTHQEEFVSICPGTFSPGLPFNAFLLRPRL